MMLYRCPYPPFPFPTYHPIRAPALANETVTLLAPAYNPHLNEVYNA
jgi:hypothetical protein